MKSKALLFSNLYATFFFALMCHWGISYSLGWDLLEATYNFIYADWLHLPHVSFVESINNFGINGYYFFGNIDISANVALIVYLVVMFFAALVSLLAAILGWVGYRLEKSKFALVAAILYTLIALAIPHGIIYTLPLVCFGFLGYSMQKSLE
jgi:hypothetical protein